MRREQYAFQTFLAVVAMLMLVPVLVFFAAIGRVQGYGRVINYTGVVRGGTQRLVKSELAGVCRNDMFEYLDGVLHELIVGDGEHGIEPMKDAQEYQKLMAQAADKWDALKIEITAVRGGADPRQMFDLSEEIFELCDKAAFEAERYSNGQIQGVKREMMIILMLLLGSCIGLAAAYRRSEQQLRRSNTERETEKQARLSNEERYRVIMERTEDILFEWDLKNHRAYCSSNFSKKFGYALPPEIFFTEKSSMRIYKEDLAAFCCLLERLSAGQEDYAEDECRLLDSTGNTLWCSVKITVLRDKDGNPERLIGILSDIDEQKREQLALKEKASCDLPTGMLNKFTLEEKVEEFLCKEGRSGEHVLYIIDLDHFKSINDGYGHAYGDFAICETAARLKSLFRETDIMGRIGGDEFVVLLKNVATEEAISKRAELVLGRIREPMQSDDSTEAICCSASMGAALYPVDGRTFRQLYGNADRALYVSKENGRDGFHRYESSWMWHGTHDFGDQIIK